MDRTIKSKRTLKRLDIAAEAANNMLGGNKGSLCQYCSAMQSIGFHWSDCSLFRIRPSVLLDDLNHRKAEVKRTANKQIMFKNEKRYTTHKQRFTRTRGTKPKPEGPAEKIRWCSKCRASRLYRNGDCVGGH